MADLLQEKKLCDRAYFIISTYRAEQHLLLPYRGCPSPLCGLPSPAAYYLPTNFTQHVQISRICTFPALSYQGQLADGHRWLTSFCLLWFALIENMKEPDWNPDQILLLQICDSLGRPCRENFFSICSGGLFKYFPSICVIFICLHSGFSNLRSRYLHLHQSKCIMSTSMSCKKFICCQLDLEMALPYAAVH